MLRAGIVLAEGHRLAADDVHRDKATGQRQYPNSYADGVVTTDTAGRYLLTNDTLTFIHMNIYALAAAGVVLVAIVVVYIAVKKRYWFW